MSGEILKCVQNSGSIAFISCPTLFTELTKKLDVQERNIKSFLLEFDKRFAKFGEQFVYYDYNEPFTVKRKFQQNSFDLVVADLPFLAPECLKKISETIKYLAKDKILLCTGLVMENDVKKYFNLQVCSHFTPRHKNNLANEFRCFSNFPLSQE